MPIIVNFYCEIEKFKKCYTVRQCNIYLLHMRSALSLVTVSATFISWCMQSTCDPPTGVTKIVEFQTKSCQTGGVFFEAEQLQGIFNKMQLVALRILQIALFFKGTKVF